uniref:G domain-containing protein n=1 Tax=Parascaris univalens TaxID=6257 RepID=A0A915C7K9_PARUN
MDLLHRAALGRIALHGELYNAHTDQFLGGISIFRKPLPAYVLRTIDDDFVKCDVKYSNSLSQRCENLGVEGELKLSICFGLISLDGSGKYVLDDSKSARSCSIALLYQSRTKVEKLNVFGEEVRKLISTDVLENVGATHVVTEIEWGANAMMTMNFSSADESKNTHAAGEMQAALKLLAAKVTGSAAVGYDKCRSVTNEDFDLHLFTDVREPNEPIPCTYDECIAFIRRIPSLIKGNDGKGRPIAYTMVSIPVLRLACGMEPEISRLCNMVDEHTSMTILNFLEQLHKRVQELNDLYEDVSRNSSLFVKATKIDIGRKLEESRMKEASIRRNLGDAIVSYRKGQITIADINAILEDPHTLSASNVHQFLDDFTGIRKKLSYVEKLNAAGVKVLLSRSDLDEFTASGRHYVLFCSMMADDEESLANRLFFDNLRRQENIKCAVVDLDVSEEFGKRGQSSVSEYVDGVQTTWDLLELYELLKNSNVIRFTSYSIGATAKPSTEAMAEVDCPGSFRNGGCAHKKRQWICYDCRMPVKYGFDKNFYCACGRTPAISATYRCSDNRHGPRFSSFNEHQLQVELTEIKPYSECNILLIGETGSGKSTWINSIMNYLSFETLDEALKHELQYLIPSEFSIQTKGANMKTIRIGESTNEVFSEGQSATQKPRTYSLTHGNKLIRFIDGPGIGDTRGPEQDKKNFDLILQELQYFQDLSAICILLTPDSPRLTVSFKYCLSELLTHLHKNAAKNIIFCFTKTRQTFYRAGQTLSTLKSYLAKFKMERNVEIMLREDNMYYFDNEAFKFLCAEKNGIQFDQQEKNAFSESWNISSNETLRFLGHVMDLDPHRTREMLSLSEARRVIVTISPILASISENIETNIRLALRHKKECESLDEKTADLESHLKIKTVILNVSPLDYPRTVCAGKNCISMKSMPNTKENTVHYEKICHAHCYLDNIELGKYPQPGLVNCYAMTNRKCRNCGCVWDVHLHIDYAQELEETFVIEETTQRHLCETRDRKKQKEILLDQCDRRVHELRAQQDRITKISAKFGTFLRNNCIIVYNDALVDYLNYEIKLAKQEAEVSSDCSRVSRLQRYLDSYKKEIDILQQSIKDGVKDEISLQDVYDMKNELFAMGDFGNKIQKAMLASENANMECVRRTEKVLEVDLHRRLKEFVSQGTKKAASFVHRMQI